MTPFAGEGEIDGKYLINDAARSVDAGYFAVKLNKFSRIFPFSALASVLRGRVTLTNTAPGERKTYPPGDRWIIRKGMPIVWETHSAEFVKYYVKVE
ncbi:cupin domain-containing protein [Edwardsiella piscicida]|uniref:cupin domain-containing protein n=1 Tax=Edwardsiella piscicida TaxID=1263550 RepID=UPI00370D84B8